MALPVVMGAIYLSIGVYGIAQNILMAIVLWKEVKIRNPTYYSMFQLCICESIVLLGSGVYTGLALLWPTLQNADVGYRICAYVIAIGFYAGSGFMVLMPLARCVHLIWPYKTEIYFNKKFLAAYTCVFYIGPMICFSFTLYRSSLTFTFFPNLYTWRYTDDEFGQITLKLNLAWDILCLSLLFAFNARSLYWVHKTRTQIRTMNATKNRSREIKLFLQCMITGASYTTCTILFSVLAFVETRQRVAQSIATHLVWLAIELQNPIIYMAVNERLRKRFLRMIRCKNREDSNSTVEQAVSSRPRPTVTEAQETAAGTTNGGTLFMTPRADLTIIEEH